MPKYMSPEVLCSRIQMDAGMFDIDNSVFGNVCEMSMVSGSSPKCDVWSFGIILLETLLVCIESK
jgi:serine/threonine protein kinase